jgi:WhiB family transcriptional regulator, redox-sensing transcriptional regulator
MERAACLAAEPELFFPVSAAGPAVAQVVAAKAVCRGCPVRAECLSYALQTAQDYGIWGGATEEERRLARGNRTAQLAG